MPYQAPTIPEVPSTTIDRLLQARFSEPADNVLKAIVAHFVCAGFQSTAMTYYALRRGSPTESYRLWVVACVLVSAAMTVASFLVYKIVVASAFIVKALLFYGLLTVALVGIAMAVAAVALYDRNAKEPPTKAALAADDLLGYEEYKGETVRGRGAAAAPGGGATTTAPKTAETPADNQSKSK